MNVLSWNNVLEVSAFVSERYRREQACASLQVLPCSRCLQVMVDSRQIERSGGQASPSWLWCPSITWDCVKAQVHTPQPLGLSTRLVMFPDSRVPRPVRRMMIAGDTCVPPAVCQVQFWVVRLLLHIQRGAHCQPCFIGANPAQGPLSQAPSLFRRQGCPAALFEVAQSH